MKIFPLDDRVVVKKLEAEKASKGGILMPDSARDNQRTLRGRVVAVGPGRRNDRGTRDALVVEVGQTVLFGRYSGSEAAVDGEDLVVLAEADVLGVMGE